MVALSCGIDAETFGSLMTLASGRCHELTELGEVVADPLLGRRAPRGTWPAPGPASEMSRSSTCTPATSVKALTTGSSDLVASAGASSVCV